MFLPALQLIQAIIYRVTAEIENVFFAIESLSDWFIPRSTI